jgi:hypothetical protein
MKSFDKGIESNKQEKWNYITKEIEFIVDKLGEPIDNGIKESVIALNAHNFGTMASCEGHLDHGFPYPWVDIGSQIAAENNKVKSRFNKLWKKYLKEKRGEEQMLSTEKTELQELIDLETAANTNDLNRLTELLNEFYELNGNENVGLELRIRMWNQVRLQPTRVPTGPVKSVKEELAKISNEEIERNLNEYREEMNRFTKFLRDRFFR